MSTPLEIAEREAAEAEAEDPDAEPEPEPEPIEGEPEPEPQTGPAPMSEKEMEAAGRKIDAESKRHSERVQAIMGEAFSDLLPCPACQIPGYVFVFNPENEGDQLRKMAMDAYTGEGRRTLRKDPTRIRCELCDGWGYLDTDAREPGNKERLCDKCSGQGHVDRYAAQPQQPALTAVPPIQSAAYVPPPAGAVPDQWGRPAGHPQWGQNPADIGWPGQQ